MRAIILAFDRCPGEEAMRLAPPFLLPLLDRPFLQHIVERLIDAGVTDFDMVHDESAHRLPAYFGRGQRWGTSIRYHCVEDPQNPLACLRALTSAAPDEPVLLAAADTLCDFRPDDLDPFAGKSHPLYFSCRETGALRNGSGWALVDGSFLASLPPEGCLETLGDRLQRSGEVSLVSNILHAGSYAELLDAQQCVIYDQVSRLAWVHSSVTLTGPVYIGAKARIERGVSLGPNVVVGANSVIGAGTCIQNSLVCPNTYVGDSLDINHSILEGDELFHTVLDASLTIREPMFLSRLSR